MPYKYCNYWFFNGVYYQNIDYLKLNKVKEKLPKNLILAYS